MQQKLALASQRCVLTGIALVLGALEGASASPAAAGPQPPAMHVEPPQAEASHAVDAVAFIVITMVIGVFTLQVMTPITRVPYTALLLVRPRPSKAIACSAVWGHPTHMWFPPGLGCHLGHWQPVVCRKVGPYRERHPTVGGVPWFPHGQAMSWMLCCFRNPVHACGLRPADVESWLPCAVHQPDAAAHHLPAHPPVRSGRHPRVPHCQAPHVVVPPARWYAAWCLPVTWP